MYFAGKKKIRESKMEVYGSVGQFSFSFIHKKELEI